MGVSTFMGISLLIRCVLYGWDASSSAGILGRLGAQRLTVCTII